MKKTLFLVPLAALALAACSNDEVTEQNTTQNQPKEIAFAPLAQKSTRAAVQGTTFPTSNTMEVRAYKSAPADAAEYFAKTTYKYQYAGGSSTGSGSTWGGDPARYWPLSESTINFFAVSAAGVNAADITIANALASATVEYDATAANNASTTAYSATTQSDIMYAFNRGAVTQSANNLTFPSNVGMEFKHALALINFQIKAGDDASTAIQIYKIELNGARYTGDLTITNTNAATVGETWSAKVDWTPNDAVDNVKVPNIGDTSTPVALTTSFVPDNSDTEEPTDWASLMIIPSTQTATTTDYGFTAFTIFYKINGNDYTYTYAPSGYTTSTPNLTAVDAGKRYTYQITMTLHEILVAPTVDDWDAATSSPFAVGI